MFDDERLFDDCNIHHNTFLNFIYFSLFLLVLIISSFCVLSRSDSHNQISSCRTTDIIIKVEGVFKCPVQYTINIIHVILTNSLGY